jgi:hypothetical protein
VAAVDLVHWQARRAAPCLQAGSSVDNHSIYPWILLAVAPGRLFSHRPKPNIHFVVLLLVLSHHHCRLFGRFIGRQHVHVAQCDDLSDTAAPGAASS